MKDFLSAPGSAGPETAPAHLFGAQGALVELSIPVDPRMLEDLIEALASLDFPVNPQLLHHPGVVYIEFPAYANHLPEVRRLLGEIGFDPASIEVRGGMYCHAAAGD